MVNGCGVPAFSQQKTRFMAISAENMRFKNAVKYKCSTGINYKDAQSAPAAAWPNAKNYAA
jgi:hypothetical protein